MFLSSLPRRTLASSPARARSRGAGGITGSPAPCYRRAGLAAAAGVAMAVGTAGLAVVGSAGPAAWPRPLRVPRGRR
jgi:hypothetical protein